MKIVFFGTPEFAASHLEALKNAGVDIVAIVTKPDKPQGRNLVVVPPAVKVFAQKNLPNIPLFQPEKCSTSEFVGILQQFQADLFVVVAYGEIIKQSVLDIPRFGCINVHASLLPRYRGAAPMQRALMNGEKEAGVTIIKLVLKMDAGDVICEEKMDVPESMTLPELESALCDLGCKALLKTIDLFEKNQVVAHPQDHEKVTYADKITPEECYINWHDACEKIHNLVRAVIPSPGAWCYVVVRGQKKRLKVLQTEICREHEGEVGSLFSKGKNTLGVACGTGGLLLKRVQLEGKQAMLIEELLKGIPQEALSFVALS